MTSSLVFCATAAVVFAFLLSVPTAAEASPILVSISNVGSADPFGFDTSKENVAPPPPQAEKPKDDVDMMPGVYHFNCDLPDNVQADLVETIRRGNHKNLYLYYSGTCLGYFLTINLFHARDNAVVRVFGPATFKTGGSSLAVLRSMVLFNNVVFDNEDWPNALLADPKQPLQIGSNNLWLSNCVFKNFGDESSGALWVNGTGAVRMNSVSMSNVPQNAVVIQATRLVAIDRFSCIRCGAPTMTIDWDYERPAAERELSLSNSVFVVDSVHGLFSTPMGDAVLTLNNLPSSEWSKITHNRFFGYPSLNMRFVPPPVDGEPKKFPEVVQ